MYDSYQSYTTKLKLYIIMHQSHVSHSYSVELYHIPYAIETLDSSLDVVHIAAM